MTTRKEIQRLTRVEIARLQTLIEAKRRRFNLSVNDVALVSGLVAAPGVARTGQEIHLTRKQAGSVVHNLLYNGTCRPGYAQILHAWLDEPK